MSSNAAGVDLVTLKTRVPRHVADRLQELADDADRSLAAELRKAIDGHLNPNPSDARKDGRK